MGIIFISITAGVAIVAIILIAYSRRKKTIDPDSEKSKVVQNKAGEDKGVYD